MIKTAATLSKLSPKVQAKFTTLSRIKEAGSGTKPGEYKKDLLRRVAVPVDPKDRWDAVEKTLMLEELYPQHAGNDNRLQQIHQRLVAKRKTAAVSDEQAQAAVNRLETLERNRPTARQAARYGTIGAVAGPTINLIGSAITKKNPYKDTTKLRGVLGDAAKGALAGGAVPLLRSHLDRGAEVNTLKSYLHERQKEASFVDTIKQVGGKALAGVHHLEDPIEVAGLAALAAPGVDNIVAKHRAAKAGDSDVEKYRQIKSKLHDHVEVGGLGVLAAPTIAKMLSHH
jgi:hypothetical protein